jgi:hypothetical protein
MIILGAKTIITSEYDFNQEFTEILVLSNGNSDLYKIFQ